MDDLVREGARLVRAYGRASDADRTEVLRTLARVILDLRQHFETSDGATDWAGRSREYRAAVARVYKDGRLPKEAQPALRYHVGNLLREVAPAEELADLGFRSARPVDRVKETRARLAALARAGAALDGTTPAHADAVRLVVGAEQLLSRVTDEAMDAAAPEGVEAIGASLDVIRANADRLSARLPRRRGRRLRG